MKQFIALTLIIVLGMGECFGHSGDTISVPLGTPSVIDGVILGTEWADASTVQIPGISGAVYFKHTTTDLFVAFTSISPYFGSTGIYIDKEHNGGGAPQTDDLWLHGSMSQWEWSGNGTSWQNSTPSGWIYVTTSANEYKISLSKLGISPDTNKTLGVLFSFMDWSTSNDEITWPSGGYSNLTNPDSWANMIILNNSIGINENKASKNKSINIYPNPGKNRLFIEVQSFSNTNVEIINSEGQLLHSYFLKAARSEIDISALSSGLYLIRTKSDKGVTMSKFIKY